MEGLIFDVEEFALFDGPGIRSVVFLKGCPLRCEWCHNPEGLASEPELMVSRVSCQHCGKCQAVCLSRGACSGCGACVSACPLRLRRMCGEWASATALVRRLSKHARAFGASGGGVTLSGGEPLAQAEFVLEFVSALRTAGMHVALESSGYAPSDVFRRVAEAVDLVIFDVKHTDSAIHRRVTGVENAPILANLDYLRTSGRPFWLRSTLIPGVTDTTSNMEALAGLLADAACVERVELLPFNRAAGAKYHMVGRTWTQQGRLEAPGRAGRSDRPELLEIFRRRGIRSVLV